MPHLECEEEQEWGREQEFHKTQTSGRAPDFHPCPPPAPLRVTFLLWLPFSEARLARLRDLELYPRSYLFPFPEGGARQFLPTLKHKQVAVSLPWSLSTCLFFLLGSPRLHLKGEEAEDLAL